MMPRGVGSITHDVHLGLVCASIPDKIWSAQTGKKIHPLSDRLASLGLIEAKLRAPLKPLNTIVR